MLRWSSSVPPSLRPTWLSGFGLRFRRSWRVFPTFVGQDSRPNTRQTDFLQASPSCSDLSQTRRAIFCLRVLSFFVTILACRFAVRRRRARGLASGGIKVSSAMLFNYRIIVVRAIVTRITSILRRFYVDFTSILRRCYVSRCEINVARDDNNG
jgi:hypothetical protein